MHGLDAEAGEAHEYRALMLVGCEYHGLGLDVVGRAHDRHAGDFAHEGQVLEALVGRPVLADRNAGVGGADLHIEMRITYRIPHLLIVAARRKHGKTAHEGHLSAGGETCGNSGHIGLRDAAVDEAVGEGILEILGLRGVREIRVQHHHIFVKLSQLHQGLSVGLTSCYAAHKLSPIFSRSAIPTLYCSSFGALPCQPTEFSM